MKIKVYLISAIAMLLGVCVLAATYTPEAIWPMKGKNAQRTGQNLAATDIDASKLKVEWMFPSLTEETDYHIKSLESPGVEIGENWISNQDPFATVDADRETVWSRNSQGAHFMYINGEITPTVVDYVTFNFTGLRPGDKYQIFMTAPSKLTKNTEELQLATNQYVRLEFQNQDGESRAGEYSVNISREEYAGTWLYVTGDIITVGPDGKIAVKLSNRGTVAKKQEIIDEDAIEYDDDGNVISTGVTGEETVYSDTALCLADAVRIVRVADRQMVGSSVASSFSKDSFLVNTDNVSYNDSVWQKVTDKMGMFVKDGDVPYFYMTRTDLSCRPLNGSMFVMKPDDAHNYADRDFTYNFSVANDGKYAVYANIIAFDKNPFLKDGNSYPSFKNYEYQKYTLFCNDTAMNDTVSGLSGISLRMSEPGWRKIGEYHLEKGVPCRLVLDGSMLEAYNGGYKAYVTDAIRVVQIHDKSLLNDSVNDIGSTPVGFSAYNNALRDKTFAKNWSEEFLSSIGLKKLGTVSAYLIKSSSTVWEYPDPLESAWDVLEGPVPGGFVTSPTLAYITDPADVTKTSLAAFIGDANGIVYCFDASGANDGDQGYPRLLFKGPGVFLSEPLGAGVLYKDWKVSGKNRLAYGGDYIYTDNENATAVRFVIDDEMREKAGDHTYYDIHNNLTGVEPKKYSSWRWRIRFWVPPVEKAAGTTLNFTVKWNREITNEVCEKTYSCKIETKDLGTWKYISVNDTYTAPEEVIVSVKDLPDGNVAVIDNLWLSPALPPGEELAFVTGNEFVTDSDSYTAQGSFADMKSGTLFAPTGAGRIFAYELKDGIDTENKIAKLSWVYPAFEDRQTLEMASAPSYIKEHLYFTARPYGTGNTYKFSLYDLDVKTLNVKQADRFDRNLNLIHDAWQGGPVHFFTENRGTSLTYAPLGSNGIDSGFYKFYENNAFNAKPNLIGSNPDVLNFFQTSPGFASYGDKDATDRYIATGDRSFLKNKILLNDIFGEVSSYEINGIGIDTKSEVFASPEASRVQNDNVVGNIVTDGYIDSVGQMAPNAYYGGADGYMTIFNSVNGQRLNKIIAGMQTDPAKSQIQGSPIILNGVDVKGESVVNLNGADGYNYTYNYVAGTEKKKWRDLPIGENWQDLLDNLETEVVDPTDGEETSNVQVELIDYETAVNLIDMFNKRSEENSVYSRLFSDDPAKFTTIPDTENTFLRKDMMIIPQEYWSYIQTGGIGEAVQNNLLDKKDKIDRLGKYLFLESQKCRMNRDYKGDKKVAGNTKDSRALFWELDNDSGRKDPRQSKGDSTVNLEWGDHIYIAVWNMPDGARLNGTSPVVFEYANRVIPLNTKAAFRPERKVPASVTKIYNFDPYTVKYEDPLDGGTVKAACIGIAPVRRKLSLIEITLDCNSNKIQTMVGSGWKMGVDMQLPKHTGKVLRFPIGNLIKSTLGDDFEPVLTTPENTWVKVDPNGYRENFAVNNPLSLQVGGKEFGKTYTRYDNANSYNSVNGVKDADIVTIDLASFRHGFLSKLNDVAKVANRSSKDLTAFRFYPTNHVVYETIGNNETNFLSDPLPWEYGVGSADYPNVDYKNVDVLNNDGEDMISYDTVLETAKPWAKTIGKDPYVYDRTGDVFKNDNKKILDVRYQIDVPRYQPAMKSYVADAIVYVDTNGNGKFDLSGSYEYPFVNCEAHRRFRIDFGVAPNPEMFMEEDNVYIGDAGHGLGYPLALNGIFTPYTEHALGLQTDGNGNTRTYNPFRTKPEVMKWFKSFTLYNDGNVNLYDVALNKEPLYAKGSNENMSMVTEGVASSSRQLLTDGGFTPLGLSDRLRIHENNVISSFDFKASSDRKGIDSGFIGANYPFASNGGNFSGSSYSYTVTKPRVGDVFGTTMTVPDTRKIKGREFARNGDYNRKNNGNDYEMDVRDAQSPMVSVAVPVGQPIGEYMTEHPITVTAKYVDKGNVKLISSRNGFNLDVNVKEAQMTGTPFDKNTAHASLYNIGGKRFDNEAIDFYSYFDDRDTAPFAFQRRNGTVGMLWANTSVANDLTESGQVTLDGETEAIDKARIPLNISFAELNNTGDTENLVAQTNETVNFYNREKWWHFGAFIIKENGWPNDLGEGFTVPKWVDGGNIKSSFLQYPSFYSDGNNEKVVFSGKAEIKREDNNEILPNEFDNRIFWMDYNFQTGADPEAIPLMHLDSFTEKKYPVMFMRGDRKWFFWQSALDGKSVISYTTDDLPGNYATVVGQGYSPEAKLRVPSAISSAGKPNIIDRDPDDNLVEVVYTGVNNVTGGTDVFMGQYSLAVNTMDNQTFGLSEKAFPLKRVYDEMRRDSKYDFYVGKGLAWMRQDVSGTVDTKNLPAVVVGLGGNPGDEKHTNYVNIFTGTVENASDFIKGDWADGNVNALDRYLFKDMNPATGSIYPKFSFDSATGVMTIEYAPESFAEKQLGKTLVDFSSGVIRFTRLADIAEQKETAGSSLYRKPVTVYASYVPQTISLTNGEGINDGGFAVYDRHYDAVTVMWRKTGAATSNGVYYKIFRPQSDSNGRLDYKCIFSDRRVVTDSSSTNINENSLSGFFDRNTKGETVGDGTGYGKLWLFWSGTKSGKNAVYYETEAIDENLLK